MTSPPEGSRGQGPPDRLARVGVVGGWLVLAAAVLAGLPDLAEWPGTGVDPSWKLAFHLCRERGLVVGRDTLYTYGPWGFLVSPLVLVRSQWLAAVGWLLGGHLALAAAVAVWMRRVVSARLVWLAPVPLLLAPPTPEYQLPLAVMLAAAVAVDLRTGRPLTAALVGVAAGLPLLVKTGPGLVAAVAVVGAAVVAALQRYSAAAVALVGGWLGAVAVLGTVALGSPVELAEWLRDTVHIALAYAPVLERGGPAWQPLLVAGAVGLAAVGAVAARPEAARAAPLLASAVGVWALAFRHGFNRQETHFAIAFVVSAALVTWVALALVGSGPVWSRRLRAGSATVLLGVAVLVVPGNGLLRLLRVPGNRVAEVLAALQHLRDPDGREESRRRLRRELPLGPLVLAELEGRTVDVLTRELAVVEAYDLAWRPRPVLQSFVACTAELDRRDAVFLASNRAPERLLVELFGLDTRDPLWDTPLTWRALARHWEPAVRDRRWLVLRRRESPRIAASSRLASFTVGLNQQFRLPAPERGHLEISLGLEPTTVGRLVGWVWKVPEVRLQVVTPTLQPARRVVVATAVNRFPLVDPPVNTPAELSFLLSAPSVGAPRTVRLVCRGPWAWRPVSVEAHQVEWLEPAPAGLREAELRPRL